MALGFDVATPQRGMNFTEARAQGYTSCYVKLGGDNAGRYVAPFSSAEITSARAAGLRVGYYWVPNAGQDPIGAADYFIDHVSPTWHPDDFLVLDNEPLDGAMYYGDAAAARFAARCRARLNIPARQVKVYLGLSIARTTQWTQTLGTGCDFIIAAYGYAPFAFQPFSSIPMSRIKGHQYSDSGMVGGVTTDLDSWTADAFDYGTLADTGTPTPIPPIAIPSKRSKSMSTVYAVKHTDGTNEWALAGDGVGPAAWITVQSANIATGWASAHGDAVQLSETSWALFKKAYTTGDTVTVTVPAITLPAAPAGSDPVAYAALGDAIKALPAAIVAALAGKLS